MKRMILFAIAAISLFLYTFMLFSEESITVEKSKCAGTLSFTKGKKELVVRFNSDASSQVKMGNYLYAVAQYEGLPVIIQLEVIFPMMTQAKVKVVKSSTKYAGVLVDGMDVFFSAKIVKGREGVEPDNEFTLPADKEMWVKIREYASKKFVENYDIKNYTSTKLSDMELFNDQKMFFLLPSFRQKYETIINCKDEYVNLTDRNSNTCTVKVEEGWFVLDQMDSLIDSAVRRYITEQQTLSGSANIKNDNHKAEEDVDYEKILGVHLFADCEKILGKYNLVSSFMCLNPKGVEALCIMMYPRDGLFGYYSAQKIYTMFSKYMRFFARVSIKIYNDKNLHNKIMRVQKKALRIQSYQPAGWFYLEAELKKAGIPHFISYSNDSDYYPAWHFASFYIRREIDGSIPVILKYMWMVFRDFDPEFYNQPDIRAFEAKIKKMQNL